MKKMIYVCSPCRPTAKDPAIRAIQKTSNIALAKKAGRKITLDGDIPIIPHLYFTAFLDDETPEEREIGMELGLDMLAICDAVYVITDDVISDGMMKEIAMAAALEIPVRMFDFKGVENKHIQELVEMLKENAGEFDDGTEELEEAGNSETSDGDSFSGCNGCPEVHTGDMKKLIDIVINRLIHFAGSGKDSLSIRIEKLDED